MKFKNLLRKALASSLLLAVIAAPFAMPELVSAADAARDALCNGISAVSGSTGCMESAGAATINGTVETIINILSVVAAIIAVIISKTIFGVH